MEYKGYRAATGIDEEEGLLHGRILGIRDIVSFHGKTVAALTKAFHEAVDDYLEQCAQMNKQPDREFSGQFRLRIDPGLHRTLAMEADESGCSLNELVEKRLKQ